MPRAQHRGPRQVLKAGAAGLLGLRTEDERSLREPCSELGLRGEETQTLVATPLKSAEGTFSHGRPAGPSRCPLLPSGPHASVSAAPLPRRPLLFLCTPGVFPSLGQHPPGPRAACCPGAPLLDRGPLGKAEGGRRGWGHGLHSSRRLGSAQCAATCRGPCWGRRRASEGCPQRSGALAPCLTGPACPCCVALGRSLALSGPLVHESRQ